MSLLYVAFAVIPIRSGCIDTMWGIFFKKRNKIFAMRQFWGGIEGLALILFVIVFAAAELFAPVQKKHAESSLVPSCSKACDVGAFWADVNDRATIADCQAETVRRQSHQFGEGCERQMRSLSATYAEESIGDSWMPYVY